MAEASGFIEVDGFKLRYQVEGTGVPTIVIGSAMEQRTFSKDLRRHLQLVFLEQRGFSPLPENVDPTSVDLATIVDDIERLRHKLGLPRIAILGHSGHS